MSELLRFIYTGKAPNLAKMADELLAAADKVSKYSVWLSLSGDKVSECCIMMIMMIWYTCEVLQMDSM